MADSTTFYDLEFHFTSGERLCVTVVEGRDSLEETPDYFQVIVQQPNDDHKVIESTLYVNKGKLDAMQSTKHVIPTEPSEASQRKWQE